MAIAMQNRSKKLAQSKKLQAEGKDGPTTLPSLPVHERQDVIKIKPIRCINEWCMIMPFARESVIALPNQMEYRDVGIVVGVSDTIRSISGVMSTSAVKIGDVVRFMMHAVIQELPLDDEPYVGRKLLVIAERNLICHMPPVRWELVEDKPVG